LLEEPAGVFAAIFAAFRPVMDLRRLRFLYRGNYPIRKAIELVRALWLSSFTPQWLRLALQRGLVCSELV
jgi:hypothetical protein